MERERFEALLNRRCAGGASVDPVSVFEEISSRYNEPHRRYHTPQHIRHCLEQFDLAADLLDDRDGVEMALWFHDVVWEAAAVPPSNERESAELFVERLGGALDEEFRDRVYRLVMVTVYPSELATPDEGYMVDIDLSSFGLPWGRVPPRQPGGARRTPPPHGRGVLSQATPLSPNVARPRTLLRDRLLRTALRAGGAGQHRTPSSRNGPVSGAGADSPGFVLGAEPCSPRAASLPVLGPVMNPGSFPAGSRRLALA